MTNIKVKVGKEEILNGKCGNVQKCAIAQSLLSIFPKVWVSDDIEVETKNKCWNIPLPSEAMQFITNFDQCVNYETDELGNVIGEDNLEKKALLSPIEFEIEVPDDLLELIGSGSVEEAKKIISSSKTLEIV